MKKIDENYFIQDKQQKLKVEDLLANDEKILWKGKPRKISFIMQNSSNLMPFAILWLIIDVSIMISIFSNGGFKEFGLFIIPFFALHLMPVWIWIGSIIKAYNKCKSTMYYITNKRIIEVSGKTAYIKSELIIKNIQSSRIKKSIWDSIFKVSDIYITATDGSMVLFDIPNGEFISNKINSLINDTEEQNEFYSQGLVCEHCGSISSSDSKKCPNCGAKLVKNG